MYSIRQSFLKFDQYLRKFNFNFFKSNTQLNPEVLQMNSQNDFVGLKTTYFVTGYDERDLCRLISRENRAGQGQEYLWRDHESVLCDKHCATPYAQSTLVLINQQKRCHDPATGLIYLTTAEKFFILYFVTHERPDYILSVLLTGFIGMISVKVQTVQTFRQKLELQINNGP